MRLLWSGDGPECQRQAGPSGQLYRYYTCGHAHKDRTDARCPVRHVSASVLETAVIGFLAECSRHPDVVRTTSVQAQHRSEAERAPLRAKLTELDRTLAGLTQQLRHCAQAVARGGIDFLGDALRQEAAALHQQKQTLLVEREQARQDLAACEQRCLDPERVRRSLARFGELMPALSPEQQRDLLLLFLERVEVRPAVKPAPDACARHSELRLKVRVHRLIEGMEERLVIDAGDRRTLPAVAATRPLLLQAEMAAKCSSSLAKTSVGFRLFPPINWLTSVLSAAYSSARTALNIRLISSSGNPSMSVAWISVASPPLSRACWASH